MATTRKTASKTSARKAPKRAPSTKRVQVAIPDESPLFGAAGEKAIESKIVAAAQRILANRRVLASLRPRDDLVVEGDSARALLTPVLSGSLDLALAKVLSGSPLQDDDTQILRDVRAHIEHSGRAAIAIGKWPQADTGTLLDTGVPTTTPKVEPVNLPSGPSDISVARESEMTNAMTYLKNVTECVRMALDQLEVKLSPLSMRAVSVERKLMTDDELWPASFIGKQIARVVDDLSMVDARMDDLFKRIAI